MRRRKRFKNKVKKLSFHQKNMLLVVVVLVLTSMGSIGYAALQQTLNITGDLALRAVKDIRVTDLKLSSTANEGYELYNSRFTSNTLSITSNLPSVGSSITYEATVENRGTVPMELTTLDTTVNVTGVDYTVDGLEVGTVVDAGTTKTFTVTLTRTTASTTEDISASAIVELDWQEYITEPYIDPILAGNDPNLLNNSLTPVIYDETANDGAGSWVIAKTTQKWYDYSNEEWANAVILNSGVSTTPGTVINVETQAKAMYVWIPRYEYKITAIQNVSARNGFFSNIIAKPLVGPGSGAPDSGAPDSGAPDSGELEETVEVPTSTIEINFIPNTQTTASSGYILHPAFTWDNNDDGSISADEHLTGIWVGKFETSANPTSTCYTSPSSNNCNNTNQEPRILPNARSLTYQSVSNQFTTAQKFTTYLTNSANIDSHMMKNSEWGAVAYLSQSIYGKYGNTDYTGLNKEIYKNDSSYTYTGKSSGLPPQNGSSSSGTCSYDDIKDRGNGTGACGAGASTTGNIYGIYDMSGGAYDYVMGYLTIANSNYATNPNGYFGWTSSSNNSGFTSKPADKYFDAYTGTSSLSACSGGVCYGHALSETSDWYSDSAGFVFASVPWFYRGGYYLSTTTAGVFSSSRNNGGANDDYSFRSVLLSTVEESTSGGGTIVDNSGASYPNLLNNSLIPVVYDETANSGAGSWVIADTTEQWYNYDNQQWANAVILNSGVSTTAGTEIDVETQAKAMYVWIPRYEYKIEGTYGTHTDGTAGTQALPGEIEVKFILSSQTTADSGYILHPAFTWDNNDNGSISADEHLTGIWVGKFETTGSASAPTILPNKKSLVSQTVSAQFTTAQVFGTYLNNTANTDAHMMKNSEWGAVAYLSQSEYGKYGNDMYTVSNKEIYKNDSSYIYTGRSSGLPPTEGYSTNGICSYNDITDRGNGTGSCGGGASTTGNIYGVYDMSGGAYEYVMGYLTIANSNYASNPNSYFGWTTSANNAGFTYKPADKYFGAYTTTTKTTACNGGICYGHALSETSGWYSDSANFVSASVPWFIRGGNYNSTTTAGVFVSTSSFGDANIYFSFRSVFLATGA